MFLSFVTISLISSLLMLNNFCHYVRTLPPHYRSCFICTFPSTESLPLFSVSFFLSFSFFSFFSFLFFSFFTLSFPFLSSSPYLLVFWTSLAPLLFSTLLYSILLYSTPLYTTLLYSTPLYSTLLYSSSLYSTLLYSTLLYSTLLFSPINHFVSLLSSPFLSSSPFCIIIALIKCTVRIINFWHLSR